VVTARRAAEERDTSPPYTRDTARLVTASLLLSVWLLLLLFGHPLGAAVHLLFLAGLAVMPWRLLRR